MGVYRFDNLEDFFEFENENKAKADEGVQDWQKHVKAGDYAIRQASGFSIYSEILPDEEPRPKGLEHYRFTKSYSVCCPDGELGDIHVSGIARILSKEEFEQARVRRWPA